MATRQVADYRSRTNLNVKVLDFVKFGGPEDTRTLRWDCGSDAHRPPSHSSKTVLSTVHVGGAKGTLLRTFRYVVAI